MLAVTTWPDVGIALVATIPGTIAALFAFLAARDARHNRSQLETPSRTSIGKQVEAANQTSIANNYRLQAMATDLGVTMPTAAAEHEAAVERMNDQTTTPGRARDG